MFRLDPRKEEEEEEVVTHHQARRWKRRRKRRHGRPDGKEMRSRNQDDENDENSVETRTSAT